MDFIVIELTPIGNMPWSRGENLAAMQHLSSENHHYHSQELDKVQVAY